MQSSGKVSAMKAAGPKQEWGRKRRKAEAKFRRAKMKAAWRKDQA